MSNQLPQLIDQLFRGRRTHIATAFDGDRPGFEPIELDGSKFPAAIAARHLTGQRSLGFYLLNAHSHVYCACIDLDDHDGSNPHWRGQTEAIYFELNQCGIIPLIEQSQSGRGSHVWLFFDAPTPAWVPRAFLAQILSRVGVEAEIFPKQDALADPQSFGNLVRFPLWGQSRFCDVETDDGEWATVDPVEALSGVTRIDSAELFKISAMCGFGELVEPSKREPAPDFAKPLADQLLAALIALRNIPPDFVEDYKQWLRVGQILHALDQGSVTLRVWDEWSRRSPKYEAGACEAKWRTFKSDKGLTLGSLMKWAQDTVGAESLRAVLEKAKPVDKVEAGSSDFTTIEKASLDYLEEIGRNKPMHFGSGIKALDDSIEGVAPGEVCVIGGRPGHGKSALARQWLNHVAKNGTPALFISEEMSEAQLAKRHLSNVAESWAMRDLVRCREEIEQYHADAAPLYIVEGCNTVDRACEVIEHFAAHLGVKIVAVDYLQLLNKRGVQGYDAATAISKELTQTIKRTGVAGLVLSQMSRDIEKRAEGASKNDPMGSYLPRNSDLRESGQIEQDADVILFAQWPQRWNPKAFDADFYRIVAGKRRNGPINEPIMGAKFHAAKQEIS